MKPSPGGRSCAAGEGALSFPHSEAKPQNGIKDAEPARSQGQVRDVQYSVYMTPAHLWSTLPEGLKGRHGGVVWNACLSEASCVKDSDHAASFVVSRELIFQRFFEISRESLMQRLGTFGRPVSSFGYFFLTAQEEIATGLSNPHSRRKQGFDFPG